MFTEEQIPELLEQLTLEEKCSLLSGSDFWHTQPVERLGIPALMVSDGPHGLRRQAENADEMGLEESVPATCFPTAAALASTWDVVLLEEIGRALAEDAKAQGVGVILGPGVNLNRKLGNRPSYPIGHGLACTTFKFTDLRAEASEVTPETGLDEVVLTVSFTVINTGGQRGVAVPQLYLGYLESSVDRPSRELRGFQHLELGRGKRSC